MTDQDTLKRTVYIIKKAYRISVSRLSLTPSQVEPDSYVVNLQGSKRDRDSEEEGDDTEEFNAVQTITGGKNVSWVVDKKNWFLETLEKNKVIQMLNDITEEEKETANNIEQEIKSLLHEVISRDINMSKKKLNQWKGLNGPFER
ncbi:hypothetical protein C1646_756649 [Rhizophagus diaphanus]|nr:hypothetical protein C1646_756649 [Rhizophagus diaphanus] [Rhizophagus sp. MUCL 43196]